MKYDFHYLLSARYAKWIIISLITLFSLLIILSYATLFFPDTALQIPSSVEDKSLNNRKKESLDFILSSPLFGVYVSNDLNEDNVKKSMLNVNLVGVLLADKNEESQVIIQTANGEEKTYKIGDKIPGGALIKRIMAGGILVEHNGTLESLSLPKNDLIFEPVAKPLQEE